MDGSELRCHKVVLACASPYLCQLLKQDSAETRNNKMKVTEFEPVTVESFLDFVYSKMKHSGGQEMLKIDFDESRLTHDLMKMSYLYEMLHDRLRTATSMAMTPGSPTRSVLAGGQVCCLRDDLCQTLGRKED